MYSLMLLYEVPLLDLRFSLATRSYVRACARPDAFICVGTCVCFVHVACMHLEVRPLIAPPRS